MGDVVCFFTPVRPLSGHGRWRADPKLLDIDTETGIAVVVGVGTSEVSYSISEKQSTSREVSTAALSSIRFEEKTEKWITDARRNGQFFPLNLRTKGSSLIGDNCSMEAVTSFMRSRVSKVSCSISFATETEVNAEDIFVSKAEFDAKTGLYQCVVKAVGSSSAASSILDTNIILKAHFTNTVASVVLPFYPAVFVQTPEVHVSDLQPASHLVITGKSNILRVSVFRERSLGEMFCVIRQLIIIFLLFVAT